MLQSSQETSIPASNRHHFPLLDGFAPAEVFPLYLVTMLSAVIGFLIVFMPMDSRPWSETSDWMIFVLGWVFVPLFAIVVSGLVVAARRKWDPCPSQTVYYLPVLVGALILYSALWGAYLHYWKFNLWALPILAAILTLATIVGIWLDWHMSTRWHAYLAKGTQFLLPMLGLGLLYCFIGSPAPRLMILILLSVVALVSEANLFLLRLPGQRWQTGLGIIALVLVLLMSFSPSLPYNAHHYNYYLGPVNDVLNGKTLTVDVNSQYGLGVILFIAAIFKTGLIPLSYQGFSFLLNLLTLAQFALIFYLARRMTGSLLVSGAAVVTAFFVIFYSAGGSYYWLPAGGPLRFLYPLVVLSLVAHRYASSRPNKLLHTFEYVLIGTVTVYSLEDALYTVFLYLAVLIYEGLSQTKGLLQFGHAFGSAFLRLAFWIIACQLFFAGYVLIRTGQFPHWDRYFAYVSVYTVDQHLTITIYPWGPWIAVIGIYLASLLGIVFLYILSRPRFFLPSTGLALGLTFMGIAQFSYYLGRSTLPYLAVGAAPAVLLAFAWFTWISHSLNVPFHFRRSSAYAFYFLLLFVLVTNLARLTDSATDTLLAGLAASPVQILQRRTPILFQQARALRHPAPSSCQVADAVQLIKKYGSNSPRVAVFIETEMTTEALMLAYKSNVFPLSNPDEDAILPENQTRALEYPFDLSQTDLLIIDNKITNLAPIQQAIINQLANEYHFTILEGTSCGIQAIMMKPK